MEENKLHEYLLMLGDNSMILGHRLSELCGHGPTLETDIALTNISLDLFGQVRHYFQYVAKLAPNQANNTTKQAPNEDSVAFLRYPHQYKNVLLVEQPNTDFAYIIARQFFFDAYHLPLLEQLCQSKDKQLMAIAQKSIKEVNYHVRFSSEWVKRLGDGTAKSHQKMQTAIDYLWPYAAELFEITPVEQALQAAGIGADLTKVHAEWQQRVETILNEATLTSPDNKYGHSGGKKGVHSEHFGYILSDLQYMQRAYPDMSW